MTEEQQLFIATVVAITTYTQNQNIPIETIPLEDIQLVKDKMREFCKLYNKCK